MNKNHRNKMIKQRDNAIKKKHIRLERIFGVITTVLHLFFAYWGGMLVYWHFTDLFSSAHVASAEWPFIACGLMVIFLGIFGAYGALHFAFINTRLESILPGYWKNL